LGEEAIKAVLVNSGLTHKEAEVYIFLAKHGALKSGEIARLMKKDKAQIFRILKILQTKSLVESTLEFPARFTAVAFETVLDTSIKTKREEVAFIENAKKELIKYLRSSRQVGVESSLEKFMVIESDSRIYPKITQMVKASKNQFLAIATISGLASANRFGVLEAAIHRPLKSAVGFRFLTEFSDGNVIQRSLLTRAVEAGLNLKARSPGLGLKLFPRMAIRDDEEALFFIKPTADTPATEHREVCLWTNCKPLVQAFTAVFEDLWRNSTDVLSKTEENEISEPALETCIFKDAETANKRYSDIVGLAEKEIMMMTSSEGLVRFWKNMRLVKNWAERGISIRVMAPITNENFQAAQKLSKFCSVKHVSTGYLETTIVDGKHLFQFKELPPEQAMLALSACFENAFYSNDTAYVQRAEKMFNDIWKNANPPSAITLESIVEQAGPTFVPISKRTLSVAKKAGAYTVIDEGALTEKEVLNKIIHARKYPTKESNGPSVMYATTGSAVIHPPDYFNLPDTMISVFHIEKQSTLGEEDAMIVFLWLAMPKGYNYVPVAIIGDNPRAHDYWKTMYSRAPAGQNSHLVEKDELQIRVHGNTLFAGWTVPIPLFLSKYSLPPACLLIEGYGDVKTVAYSLVNAAGHRSKLEQNYFDAFVTFYHPSSKYSGPGTDGYFVRDFIATLYPPK
jgi:sugar-specific transcriptional regulator TrmB